MVGMVRIELTTSLLPKQARYQTALHSDFYFDGGTPGGRTRHLRIMRTSYGFRHPFQVCGLDCLLSLRPARTVSTRPLKLRVSLGIATPQGRGFPEFEQFYRGAE